VGLSPLLSSLLEVSIPARAADQTIALGRSDFSRPAVAAFMPEGTAQRASKFFADAVHIAPALSRLFLAPLITVRNRFFIQDC